MLMLEIKCPFCGRINVNRAHINILCPCGAKYYIHNNEFWERKPGGKIVKEVPFMIFNAQID